MGRIQVGADFLIPSIEAPLESASRYAATFRQIEAAARGGLHGVWVTEHHFSNYGYTPNPLMLLAGVAREFPQLYVGTAVIVLPLWHPLRLAEDLAVLDILAEGKLIVGIGRGYQPYEFLGLGQDIANNRQQSEEAVEVLIRAWTESDFTHQGVFYSVPEPVTVLPRPRQRPHPPLWCATTSPESVQYAARKGFGFMLPTSFTPPEIAQHRRFVAQAVQDAGHDPARLSLAKNTYVFCSTDEDNVRLAVEGTRWQQRTAKFLRDGHRPACGMNESPPYPGEPSDADMRARMIVGNPDECIAQIGALERAGLTYITGVFEYPGVPLQAQLDSIELFGKEVMPAVSRGA